MSTQPIPDELRQWIREQADAGYKPASLIACMTRNGWPNDLAVEAVTGHFSGPPVEVAGSVGAESPSPSLSPMPEPALADSPSGIWAVDRRVDVLLSLENPRVVLFGGLLSHAECDEIVALASARTKRSHTMDMQTGGSNVDSVRTSEGMFFSRGETAVIQRVEARIAALVNWPVEQGEGVQVLHYRPGAEYKPHYDYFDPAMPGSARTIERGGQRVGTVVMYLNTPEKGGGTTFPDVHLEVSPIKGNAVFFSYDRPHPVTRSLHGSAPVIAGEKWVATKWLRERRFD